MFVFLVSMLEFGLLSSPNGDIEKRSVESGEECIEPWSHVPDHMLPDLWHVVYWTSMVLTW